MGDNLKSYPEPRRWEELSEEEKRDAKRAVSIIFVLFFCFIGFTLNISSLEDPVPEIKVVSMDFAAAINNDSTSHYGRDTLRNARWDLLIRVPEKLVGDYICLQGSLQASFLYKDVTLVTSSIQSYNNLKLDAPQLLKVSAVVSEEDLSGAFGKEIFEAIKERNEVRFRSRLSLTDCREKTEKGLMSFECGEATLGFEPSDSDHIKATSFGKHPTCVFNL